MRRRPAALALAALAAVCGPAVVATAQTGSGFSVPIEDREGDHGKRGLDIVRAALGRDDKGRLVGNVRMAKAWDADQLRNADGSQGSVCLRLFVEREPDAEPPDHLVCATARASGNGLVGRVLRDTGDGPPTTVANARVGRPSRRAVSLRFTQASVRRPARLRFAAETVRHGARCDAALGCRDMAPDAPGTIGIRLR
jgi:hypothetical protein